MNESIRDQVLKICAILDDKKAQDIVAINVGDRTVIADWFIICSGHVQAQVKSLCDELEDKAPELGLELKRKEGYQEGRWIVMDFGSILVHIFHPEEREYYNIERLWSGSNDEGWIDYSRDVAN